MHVHRHTHAHIYIIYIRVCTMHAEGKQLTVGRGDALGDVYEEYGTYGDYD